MTTLWNVQPLTSRDRVKSITISNNYGQNTQCVFQMERLILDANHNVISSSGLADISCTMENVATDPVMGPLVGQISAGLAGLSQVLYVAANPNATITPD